MSTLLIVALVLAVVLGVAFLIGDLIVVEHHTISTRELPNVAADLAITGTGTTGRSDTARSDRARSDRDSTRT